MVRSGLFESHGGFDTMFDPFGPEDLDFSLRLQKAGYESVFVPEAVAYHEVSHTFGADYSAVYARHKMRHWLLFMRRHASRWKITLFFLITAPWLLLRVVAREGLRGNFAAVGGLARGVWDSVPIGRKPAGRTRGENGNLPAESSSRRANNPGA